LWVDLASMKKSLPQYDELTATLPFYSWNGNGRFDERPAAGRSAILPFLEGLLTSLRKKAVFPPRFSLPTRIGPVRHRLTGFSFFTNLAHASLEGPCLFPSRLLLYPGRRSIEARKRRVEDISMNFFPSAASSLFPRLSRGKRLPLPPFLRIRS